MYNGYIRLKCNKIPMYFDESYTYAFGCSIDLQNEKVKTDLTTFFKNSDTLEAAHYLDYKHLSFVKTFC